MGDFDTDHDRLLAGEDVPRDANKPITGWYRVKARGRDGTDRMVPARYQYVGDYQHLECFIDGRKVDEMRAIDLWPWASANPVSEEAYRAALNGHPWPDVDAAVHAAKAGSNNPPPGEELPPEAQLAAEVNRALAGLTAYAQWHVGRAGDENNPKTLVSAVQDKRFATLVADDAASARAQSLRDMLLGLKGQAEKKHKAEKAPHLDAGRAIDRKWFDVRDLAAAGADLLRAAMSAWETSKLQAAQALAATAQKEELDRRVAEATKEAETTGKPVVVVAPPPPAAAMPAAPRRIKGGSGKAASVAIVTQVLAVENWSALFAHFMADAEVRALLIKLANHQLRNGNAVPGVTTQQTADVK